MEWVPWAIIAYMSVGMMFAEGSGWSLRQRRGEALNTGAFTLITVGWIVLIPASIVGTLRK